MSEPTITIKPTDQILAKANEESVITDSNGRVIKLKKPGILAQYRLVEALGDVAANAVYRNMVIPLIYVTEIDGMAVNPPKSKLQVEALVQQLDEAGIEAVMTHVQELYGATDPEQEKAAIKN